MKKKKKYISPKVEVLPMEGLTMVCGSDTPAKQNVQWDWDKSEDEEEYNYITTSSAFQ